MSAPRGVLRTLLLVEVVLCFAPMTSMLMIGVLLTPLQVVALIAEPLLLKDIARALAPVGSGVVGLVTLLFLLDTLFDETATIKRPWLVLAGAVIGLMSLLDPLTSPTAAWRFLAAMPIIAGMHVLFLSRRTLFPAIWKR